ncbi:MAG: hypothetical protein PHR16_18080 [Methylovulum sp.]|nr:hypothetical protein [Methylovulum sp.]
MDAILTTSAILFVKGLSDEEIRILEDIKRHHLQCPTDTGIRRFV